jgi:predicted component of type VI protein secretion system
MATLRLVPATGNPIDVAKATTLVGRDPGCDIVLADGSVSRKHARLEERSGNWYVVDQGSANGTFVDSQRATDMSLHGGQEVRFGAVAFRVEIEGSDTGATILTEVEPAATMLQATAATPARPQVPAPAPPRPAAVAAPPPPRPSAPPAPPARVAPGRPASAPGPFVPKAAPKRRGPGLWIALGCCGCLLVIGLGVGAIIGIPIFATSAPASVARQHIAAVSHGEQEAAYGLLSQSLKAQMPLEQFLGLVAAHPALRDNVDATLTSRSRDASGARLIFALKGSAGEQERVQYTLVSENGGWRISGIEFVTESATP